MDNQEKLPPLPGGAYGYEANQMITYGKECYELGRRVMREKVLNALENCKKPVYPGQEPKPLTFPLTFEKINPTWGTPETYLKLAREIEKAHGIKEQT